jgi:hypothetical protein
VIGSFVHYNTAKAIPIASIDSVHFVNKERLPAFSLRQFLASKAVSQPSQTPSGGAQCLQKRLLPAKKRKRPLILYSSTLRMGADGGD